MGPKVFTTFVVVVALGASSHSALTSTDRLRLTGSWTRASDDAIKDTASEKQVNQAADSFCGARCTIRDDGNVLIVLRDEYLGSPELKFRLDSSETKNSFQSPAGMVTLTSSAEVIGDRLKIASRVSRGAIDSRQSITAYLDKDRMLIERQLAGREPAVRRQVYTRR